MEAVMTSHKPYLAAAIALVTLGVSAGQAQAQVECRWENNRPVCQDAGAGTTNNSRDRRFDDRRFDDRRYDDRYDDRRYDDRYNNGRYGDRYDDRYYNNGRFNNSSRSRISRDIERLYQDVLGRNPDRRGLDTYVDRVASGSWDLLRVRRDLAESREAADAIDRVYREVLGRSADSSGLRTYQQRLRDGWSLSRVRQNLADSNEARRR
jgi:hypothetical protein